MYLLTIALLACVGLSAAVIDYCTPALCTGSRQHIACNGLTTLSPSCGPGTKEINLTPANQALILNTHNMLRSNIASGINTYHPNKVFPQAVRMPTLLWDQELANIAAANVRRCVFKNDVCRSTVRFANPGQNLAKISYSRTAPFINGVLSALIFDWYSEQANANRAILARFRSVVPTVAHFTQVVSDRTIRVGCALVEYNKGQSTDYYLVCNYSAPNVLNAPVYVAGSVGSKCATGRNKQYPGLCSANEFPF